MSTNPSNTVPLTKAFLNINYDLVDRAHCRADIVEQYYCYTSEDRGVVLQVDSEDEDFVPITLGTFRDAKPGEEWDEEGEE